MFLATNNFFSNSISKSSLLDWVIGERAFFVLDFFYDYFRFSCCALILAYLDGVSSSFRWAVDLSLAFLKITRKAINSAIKVSTQEIG